jgi:nicotinamide mononucleotide transporter
MIEAFAVITGLAYVLLSIRRQRSAWLAGGVSAALLAGLAWQSRLPLQAVLQLFYVAMAVYGWYHWTAEAAHERPAVVLWGWRPHLAGLFVALLLSAPLAWLLARSGAADWPWIEALTTAASLWATLLAARLERHNWLYWIVIDAVLAWLFAVQGLFWTALLFAVYVAMAVIGWRAWRDVRPQAATGHVC